MLSNAPRCPNFLAKIGFVFALLGIPAVVLGMVASFIGLGRAEGFFFYKIVQLSRSGLTSILALAFLWPVLFPTALRCTVLRVVTKQAKP